MTIALPSRERHYPCIRSLNNTTLDIFTSSGRRELAERCELFLNVDFSLRHYNRLSRSGASWGVRKQAWNIKYRSQFAVVASCLMSLNSHCVLTFLKAACRACRVVDVKARLHVQFFSFWRMRLSGWVTKLLIYIALHKWSNTFVKQSI